MVKHCSQQLTVQPFALTHRCIAGSPVEVLLARTTDRPEITDIDVIWLCSEAAGSDTTERLRGRWEMPPPYW